MWNSLEVAKLGVALATPVVLVLFGLLVNRRTRLIEEQHWTTRKVVERRLELHGEMAQYLNDVYCFIASVGHFRDVRPLELIATKRKVDRIFFANQQLFDEELVHSYRDFMTRCFHTAVVEGEDTRIKTNLMQLKQERGDRHWEAGWSDYIADQPLDDRVDQISAYAELMHCFARQVGVGTK